MNKFYESEKLKEKIKERGSLYGVPSTEFSSEREIAELIEKMPAMITKPNNLFDKGELEDKYRIFVKKTQALKDEEEAKEALATMSKYSKAKAKGSSVGIPGKDPFSDKMKTGAVADQHELHVGMPKKQIVQSLDPKEKDLLRHLVQEERSKFEEMINKKYHDRFNCKSLTFTLLFGIIGLLMLIGS